jgi:signal transduction histidine kinase
MDKLMGRDIQSGESESMHDRIQSLDWSSTPIGDVTTWPQSLKATIKTLLGSRYPMILLWGESLIQIYNDAYTGLIGDKHPYALGRSIKETQAESWDTIGPMIHHVMQTGISNWVPAQLLAVNRSGFNEETYFSLSYSAVEDDHNEIKGMLCVCSEVTQQVIGERRLRIQRDLASKAGEIRNVEKVCQDIATALQDYPSDVPFMLLYLLQENGTLQLVSSAGIDPQGVFPVAFNIHSADDDPWGLLRAAAGETVLIEHVRHFLSVHRGVWNEPVEKAVALAIPSATHGNPLGVVVAGVSPNTVLDDNYRSFYELLTGQLSVSLRNAFAYEEERRRAEALAEVDRAKTAFFSNVSHEFRTPLTLMLGPLEEVLADANTSLSPGHKVHITTAYQNALRLLKLVNTLLDFSRIEANRAQAFYTPVDLSTMTSQLTNSFESAVKKAGLEFIIDCPPLSEFIYVDQEMWEKILFNLVSNALKFTFAGSITVALKETETAAILTVQDTGVGIPTHELPNVFKRFHRVQNSRSRSHEGTGIGLALTKELVLLHGGSITVESTEDEGSLFTVTIPKGTAHLDKAHIDNSKTPASASGTLKASYLHEASLWSRGNGWNPNEDVHADVPQDNHTLILIVDDNAEMLNYLHRILHKRWRVETVRDGREALDFMLHKKPDLVVSDVMMPNMNGFELLSAIRVNNSWNDIPVILLSARAGKEATVEGLEKGANDYLVKPFYADELIARVAAQLEIKRMRLDSAELEERVKERTLDLIKTNNELQQYAYVASHDLQEPLRKITFFSELLLKRAPADEASLGYLDKISNSAKRMRILINDLLNFSRLSNIEVAYERTDLNTILKEVLADFELLIAQKGATIIYDDLPVIDAVPLQMSQLFYNLISNALKFSADDRRPLIVITYMPLENDEITRYQLPNPPTAYCKIEVKDNGIGFSDKYSTKIFEIFQRLNNRSSYAGTGIGLALCKKIVENHQGRITASAVDNEGATFTVILPAYHPF